MTLSLAILILSSTALFYIYGGYYLLLKLFAFLSFELLKGQPYEVLTEALEDDLPTVTVFVSAFNEEEKIIGRLHNLAGLEYPTSKLEIIIVSDGSTDKTVSLVKQFMAKHPDLHIELIEFKENKGRAAAQNEVARKAKNEILVATDAETRFPPDILKKLIAPFLDSRVGVVGGRVMYLSQDPVIGQSISTYRSLEAKMRHLETQLGIGFQTDGPCVAFRKAIWEEIRPYEDVDQVISLIARKKGFITVQADEAIAFDKANAGFYQEIKSRSRMTRKGLFSKLGRWGLQDLLKYPGFSFALFSHKILRYFSPLFFTTFLISAFAFALETLTPPDVLLVIFIILFTLAAGHALHIPMLSKVTSRLISFVCANIGFGLGIFEWLKGNKEGVYQPTRRIA